MSPTAAEQKAEAARMAEEAIEQEATPRVEAVLTEPGTEIELHQPDTDPVMGDIALIPSASELQTLAQLATTFSASNIVPRPLQGRPNDVFLVLLTARDLHLSVTVALRECHVIDGRVTVSPKLKLATIRSQGLGRVWPDPNNDAKQAVWFAQRADDPQTTFRSEFTIEQATLAGLANKDNWKRYPARMLSWRAVGYLIDDVFGEVGTGLYSPDELGAITDEDGNPVDDIRDVPPVGNLAGTRRRDRQSGATRRAGPDEVADEETRAAFKERLDALPPPAFAVAKKLWADNHLGRVETLAARKVKTAEAVVASVEKRALGGEWGDWVGHDPTTSPTDAQDGPEGGPEGAEAGEAPGGPQGAQEAPVEDVCLAPGCDEPPVIYDDEGNPWCEQHRPL